MSNPPQQDAPLSPPPLTTHTHPFPPLAAAEEEVAAALAAAGEAPPEDVPALLKANAALKAARAALSARAAAVAPLFSRRIPPREGATKVLQAAWYALGHTPESLGDAGGVDAKAFSWPTARLALGESLMAEVTAIDPSAPATGRVWPWGKPDAIRALVDGLTPEDLTKSGNSPLFAGLLAFAKAAVDVRDAAEAKRKREAAEAEAKAKADAEAAAAAAEAAAAAAEAAAAPAEE